MKKLDRKNFSFTAELAKDSKLLFDVRMSLLCRIRDLEERVSDYKSRFDFYIHSGDYAIISEFDTILDSYQSRLSRLREFTDKLYLDF